jgi:methyl-accepting chemotaxis protein
MQIRSRLTISYGVLLLFIVATLAVAVVRFDQVSRQIDELVNQDAALVEQASVINLNAESVASRLLLLFILEDREQRMALYREMDSRNQEIDQAVERLQQLIPQRQDVISELGQLRAAYQERLQSTVETLEMGQRTEARRMMADETRSTLDRLLAFTDNLARQQRVSMQTRQQQTLATADQSVHVMVLLGIVALVLGVLMSVLITRSIVKPLNNAVAAADRIAAGDLSAQVPSGKADELGVLLNSMANMREHLLGVIDRIRQNAAAVSHAADQMRHVAEDVRADTDGQSQQTAEIERSVVQSCEGAEAMVDDLHITRDQALKARDLAQQGVQEIGVAAAEITRIADIVAESAKSVTRLTLSAEEVTGSVGLIREIADQTNLLALNASIEAARAGDSGRGFAVVADEVRNLARRTAEVTAQIDTVIATINSQTEESATRIAEGRTGMERGAGLIQKLIAPLETLQTDAQRSLDSLENLTQLAQQQAQESQVISGRVSQIAGMASTSRDAAEQLAQLTDQLLQTAKGTETVVGSFKLH